MVYEKKTYEISAAAAHIFEQSVKLATDTAGLEIFDMIFSLQEEELEDLQEEIHQLRKAMAKQYEDDEQRREG